MENAIRHQDRVAAEVQCMMCGRLIGELFGLAWREASGQRTARSVSNLTAFRAAGAGAPVVALTGRERFRCSHCGGPGVIEEVSVSVMNDRPEPEQLCPVHGERMHGVGRPPKHCRCHIFKLAA